MQYKIHRVPLTLSYFHLRLRVAEHTQPLNALEGAYILREVELRAQPNIQSLDTLEVCKHCTAQLRAPVQAQAVDALEVHKGGIRDGGLPAPGHVQSVDTLQVGEGSISDGGLGAICHVESVNALFCFW